MTGREQGFEEREEITMLWLIGTKRYKGRSLYENSETMVEHFTAEYQDSTKEAVLTIHLREDDHLLQTKTGTTII